MKPAQFDYHAPDTTDEVLTLLSELDDAEPVAGNQSMSIILNNRIATPNHLVDLNGIEELAFVEATDDTIEIGAMTRHRTIEHSGLLEQRLPILPAAAGEIAGPAVRNMGTMGGSLAEADPVGNYPNVLRALDATVTIVSADGSRETSIHDFFLGPMMTDLGPDELIEQVSIRTDQFSPSRTGMAFHELKQVPQTWPKLSASAVVRVDDPKATDPTIEHVRLVLGNVADVPLRVENAESLLHGEALSDAILEETVEKAAAAARPTGEVHADAEYKEDQIGVFTRRALTTAYDRATGKSR